MKVRFATDVLEEVKASAAYYDAAVDELGAAFLAEFRVALARAKANQLQYRAIGGPYRRVLFRRFRHGLIYRYENDTLTVLAVMHLSRSPGYWLERDK